ncbi:MAG: hypothetical protein JST92_06590 [Deltaproteobacteria bacterium]|nr:hypothetical protein [Deltaproteobacteria bacterium]
MIQQTVRSHARQRREARQAERAERRDERERIAQGVAKHRKELEFILAWLGSDDARALAAMLRTTGEDRLEVFRSAGERPCHWIQASLRRDGRLEVQHGYKWMPDPSRAARGPAQLVEVLGVTGVRGLSRALRRGLGPDLLGSLRDLRRQFDAPGDE